MWVKQLEYSRTDGHKDTHAHSFSNDLLATIRDYDKKIVKLNKFLRGYIRSDITVGVHKRWFTKNENSVIMYSPSNLNPNLYN